MKTVFGNFIERLIWGGTTLTDVERELLLRLVASLPPDLRLVAEKQFEAYNLVQREVDGRALNFYRKKGGKASDMEGLRLLDMTVEEAPLVRLTARISGDDEPLHATLTAINGRIFCMALSRRVRPEGKITVVDIKQAWRSNFRQ